MKGQEQQGDVMWKNIDAIPSTAKEIKHDIRGIVFAEGESTGHYHAIQEVEGVKMFEENGVRYVCVLKDKAVVKHQEHKPVVLPKGNYKIGIVQEYDWFADEIKNVLD